MNRLTSDYNDWSLQIESDKLFQELISNINNDNDNKDINNNNNDNNNIPNEQANNE